MVCLFPTHAASGYIGEWYFLLITLPEALPVPLPSRVVLLGLLVPCNCWCHWHHQQGHQGAGSLHSVSGCLGCRHCCFSVCGVEFRSQAPLPYPVSSGCEHRHHLWGGGGQNCRPCCCPGSTAHHHSQSSSSVHCFPTVSLFSVTPGLASRAPCSLFPHSAPSVFQSTHLHMYTWMDLSSILVN